MNKPIIKNKTNTEFVQSISIWFRDLINLEEGMDRERTITFIKDNKQMRGANAWLLMCSIMIASLGLDQNSPAVIIGAMLISPLMSPILGIGLGVGINDKEVLYDSLKHFGIALLIALVTSTLYFSLTPFGHYTPEIDARTRPTLLDGLVAVFGGFAGIISVTRKEQSNAVPGVAIATALMPPICVSGYGIATGEWAIMLNAFYLFFLNSFFIATTTFLIIRLLRFPYHQFLNDRERRRTQFGIVLFSIIMIIPSALILLNVLKKIQTEHRVEQFTKEHFSEDPQALNHQLQMQDSSNILFVTLIGKPIPPDSMGYLYEGLDRYKIKNTELVLIQDMDPEIQEVYKLQSEMKGFQKTTTKKLDFVNKIRAQKEKELQDVHGQLAEIKAKVPFQMIAMEAQKTFKDLIKMDFSKVTPNDTINQTPIVFLRWNPKKRKNKIEKNEKKLRAFIEEKTGWTAFQFVEY